MIVLTSLFAVAGVAATLNARGPDLETQRGHVIHTLEPAPDAGEPYLEWIRGLTGFVPDLAGVMAESPALANTCWKVRTNLQERGSLTPAEDNIVRMAIAVENECQDCMAGGTMAGEVFLGSSDAELLALRASARLLKAKFEQKTQIRGRLEQEQLRLRAVESPLRSFEGAEESLEELIVKPVAAQPALAVREHSPTMEDVVHFLEELFLEVPRRVGRAAGPVIGMNRCDGVEMGDLEGEMGVLREKPHDGPIETPSGRILEPRSSPRSTRWAARLDR